jgi:hypothetical protein
MLCFRADPGRQPKSVGRARLIPFCGVKILTWKSRSSEAEKGATVAAAAAATAASPFQQLAGRLRASCSGALQMNRPGQTNNRDESPRLDCVRIELQAPFSFEPSDKLISGRSRDASQAGRTGARARPKARNYVGQQLEWPERRVQARSSSN